MSKELTDAKRRAIKKYDSANTKQIHLKLNLKTDAKILNWLKTKSSVQGYIKALIDADMKKTEKANKAIRTAQNYLESQVEQAIREGFGDDPDFI